MYEKCGIYIYIYIYIYTTHEHMGFPGGSSSKEATCQPVNAGDVRGLCSTPALGRSLGGSHGNPF